MASSLKKTVYILILLFCTIFSCKATTEDSLKIITVNAQVESDTHIWTLKSIEFSSEQTIANWEVYSKSFTWVSIQDSVYIEDVDTQKRYYVKKTTGIPLNPDSRVLWSGQTLAYSNCFDPIEACSFINYHASPSFSLDSINAKTGEYANRASGNKTLAVGWAYREREIGENKMLYDSILSKPTSSFDSLSVNLPDSEITKLFLDEINEIYPRLKYFYELKQNYTSDIDNAHIRLFGDFGSLYSILHARNFEFSSKEVLQYASSFIAKYNINHKSAYNVYESNAKQCFKLYDYDEAIKNIDKAISAVKFGTGNTKFGVGKLYIYDNDSIVGDLNSDSTILGSLYLQKSQYLSYARDLENAKLVLDTAVAYSPYIFYSPNNAYMGKIIYYAGIESMKGNNLSAILMLLLNKAKTKKELNYDEMFEISSCYTALKRYKEADSLLTSAVNKYKHKITPNECHLWCMNAFHLSDSLYNNRLKQYSDLLRSDIYRTMTSFSSKERDEYWVKKSNLLNAFFNWGVNEQSSLERLKMSYDNALFTKSILLHSDIVLKNLVASNENKELLENYKTLNQIQEQTVYDSLSPNDFKIITERIMDLETKIRKGLNGFEDSLRKNTCTWNDVRRNLKKGELAIEIINCTTEGKSYYAALCIDAKSESPEAIMLCEDAELRDIIGNRIQKEGINSLYTWNREGETLYNCILKELYKKIKDYKKVYISKSGAFHNLNLSIIPVSNNKRINDLVDMHEVLSTQNIISGKRQILSENKPSAAVYGGLFYSMTDQDILSEKSKYKNMQDSYWDLAMKPSEERIGIRYLPWTQKESSSIDSLFHKYGFLSNIFQGNDGIEESFKALDGNSPAILHLATHGFFLSSNRIENAKWITNNGFISEREQPLLSSGILMSGAYSVWTGADKIPGVDDGILTSYEISKLDLSNTQIAVLSACNTAKGKIDNVDGVFGLQRAFKLAGVNTIVMSLWQVPDESTCLLMTKFYKNLLKGMGIHKAMKKAQDYLMKKNPEPFKWGAFVVLD